MTVSAFIDESGKFHDHKVICIGCVAGFNNHLDEFAREWGHLLAINGMKEFHANKALKFKIPLGTKNAALGLKDRTEALLPFIRCIRKFLALVVGCWIDVKVFKNLPSHFFQVFGKDPSYMAFMRTIMQVVDFTPDSDGIVLVCDEDEETVLQFYALYRRIKKVMPGVKRKLAAISFCDDTQVMAVQAADLIAAMVRLDALARRDKKKHHFRRLFQALTAEPKKDERIWFCGIAKGDKKALLQTAKDTTEDLKKRKLIT